MNIENLNANTEVESDRNIEAMVASEGNAVVATESTIPSTNPQNEKPEGTVEKLPESATGEAGEETNVGAETDQEPQVMFHPLVHDATGEPIAMEAATVPQKEPTGSVIVLPSLTTSERPVADMIEEKETTEPVTAVVAGNVHVARIEEIAEHAKSVEDMAMIAEPKTPVK